MKIKKENFARLRIDVLAPVRNVYPLGFFSASADRFIDSRRHLDCFDNECCLQLDVNNSGV